MEQENKNRSWLKWVGIILATILALVGVFAVFAKLFAKDDETPIESDNGGTVIETQDADNVKLMLTKLSVSEYADYSVATTAEAAYTVTATVLPDDTSDKTLTLTFDWVDPDSEWASGKAVGEYFAATKSSDNVWALSVNKAFGEQIGITVTTSNYVEGDTSTENLALKATCTVDYVKRVQSVFLSCSPSTMVFDSTTTVSYNVTYGDGTLQGTFTGGVVDLKLASGLYSACSSALTSGSWVKSDTATSFANLSSVSSQTVNVGKCTRFISVTGNPGTGESQWQSAFRTYINSHFDPHATLSMDWDYTYQGTGSSSGTATANVFFDVDSVTVKASSVTWDVDNIVM